MAFPKTREAVMQAGYRFQNHGKCRGCGEDIEWYFTPNGKMLPFNLMPADNSEATPHWVSCPNAADFRSGSTSR